MMRSRLVVVIARLDRATQYARALVMIATALEYWVPACAGTTRGATVMAVLSPT